MTFEELQKYCDELAIETMANVTKQGATPIVVEIVVYDPAHGYPVRATHVIPHNIKDISVERWKTPEPQVSRTGKNTDAPG